MIQAPSGHSYPLQIVILMMIAMTPATAVFGDAIDQYVNSEMRKQHIPGLSLAVVRDGKVEKLAGYGLADIENKVAVTPETVFQIQSITKTFTSTAVVQLVNEGKLSLDDPVGKHLEGTPDSWKAITIRHLLSHTSGIKDFINDATASLRLDASEEEVLHATAPRPLNFQPGEKYEYSNTNYHLLAMILRKHTGKFYGDVLKERIFEPLEMKSTRIVSWRDLIPNRAAGYEWDGTTMHNGDFVAESILGYGGGGIVSTAADMAKWAASLSSEKILPNAMHEEAWRGEKLNDGSVSGYGLGWGVMSINDHRAVGHSGAHITGFTSSMFYFRDDHLAVVVLTNAGHANPSRIALHVVGLAMPALMPTAMKPIEDKEPKVTQMLRDVLAGIAEGNLKPDSFVPGMWKVISAQLGGLREQAKAHGDLKQLDLVEHKSDARKYTYRATYSGIIQRLTMVLDADGKITGFWIAEE